MKDYAFTISKKSYIVGNVVVDPSWGDESFLNMRMAVQVYSILDSSQWNLNSAMAKDNPVTKWGLCKPICRLGHYGQRFLRHKKEIPCVWPILVVQPALLLKIDPSQEDESLYEMIGATLFYLRFFSVNLVQCTIYLTFEL